MSPGPGLESFVPEKDAYCESCFAVGGHVENIFAGRSLGSISQRHALAHKIILVHVSLATGVSLHATQSHGVGRWSLVLGHRASAFGASVSRFPVLILIIAY